MAEEEGLTFPIAYGVTEESVASLAPWWTEDRLHGRYLQPMEFLVRRGVVFGSMYASGPIGRMGVRQAMAFIKQREKVETGLTDDYQHKGKIQRWRTHTTCPD